MSAPRRCLGRTVSLAALTLVITAMTTVTALAQDPLGLDATPPAGETAAPAEQKQLTTEDVQKMFKDADQAIKDKDYETALKNYDTLVRILKQQGFSAQVFLPVVYTGRGQAFAGLDDPEAAKADFDEALKENSTHLPALIARGKLYLELGANDVALQDFEAAKEQDRGNPEVMFGLGKAYVLLGGPQQAIKPLTYAIAADENNAEAYRLRAQAYSGVGKNKEADEDIQKSLELNPDDYETYFALATVLLREEKYNESVDAIEESIKRYKPKEEGSDTPYVQGFLTKAAVLLEAAKKEPVDEAKQEVYKQALAECDKLLDQTEDTPAYAQIRGAIEFRRGVCLRLMGRYGDAIAALTAAINSNPDLAEAYFRRGICFYYIDEDDLAVLDFKNAGNLEYQDPRPKLWEGFAFAKKGEYYEAVRAYGEALAESDRYVPAYVNRGLAYMMLKEYDKALKDFNEAVRLEPAEWTHYFKRGMAYERLGKKQEAANSFVSAIRFYDQYPPAFRHAAAALTALGHNDIAQQYREKASELEAEQKKAEEQQKAAPSQGSAS
jgi:tetratricopeptide (TPR) repeat protein